MTDKIHARMQETDAEREQRATRRKAHKDWVLSRINAGELVNLQDRIFVYERNKVC